MDDEGSGTGSTRRVDRSDERLIVGRLVLVTLRDDVCPEAGDPRSGVARRSTDGWRSGVAGSEGGLEEDGVAGV